MSEYKLSEIFIYPVKSLPGISVNDWVIEERGLQLDRRWMLVDKHNIFITQRHFPQMVFISVKIKDGFLLFNSSHNQIEPLNISLTEYPENEEKVKVWDDVCFANVYDHKINNWFSEVLKINCKLVYMPDTTTRKTSTKYFEESKNVSFADGYPFLIIGKSSLAFLNSKLEKSVSMQQFRPNFVFSGGLEHDEDKWKKIIIGQIEFAVVKPCARCVITTIDISTGRKNKEPLKTLSSYRNSKNKILFGQNLIALNNGIIKVGDQLVIDKLKQL